MRIKSLVRGLSALLVTLLGGVAVAQHTASYTQVVNPATGTISIVSSLNPSQYTQSVTFTATVPSTASGTVTFFDGATKINATPAAIISGSASASISTLSVGNHNITATFTADANSNYASASTAAPLVQTVKTGPSGIALTSSPNPSTFGANVSFTATLASTATGNVTFYDTTTSTTLGTVAASSGTAVLPPISTLTVGTHNVVAQYAGDTSFSAANSANDAQVVNKAGTTSDVLTSSLNPATYGATVTFTATLPANATGTVTFLDGATPLSPVSTISGGVATYQISNLAVGPHSITASYAGDSNYASTTSNTVTETITQKTGDAITLSSSANPANFGASVVFTVKLTTDATGTVTFFDGATQLGASPSTISGGVATYTTSTLSVLTHPITAKYSGDSNYSTVTSTILSEEIDPVSATMTISGNPNPSIYGGTVVMTITVTGVNGVIPTGTVTLTDALTGTQLGTGPIPLDATGKAPYSTSALSAGSHPITATYSGDSNYK